MSETRERRKLPDTRQAVTHKFSVAGHKGYITVGLYDDDTPGEVFIVIAKEGSTISGLMDTVAVLISLSLQWGVPLSDIVRKLSHTRFEPSGPTGNPDPDLRTASSITDYIARWLAKRFAPNHTNFEIPETIRELGG